MSTLTQNARPSGPEVIGEQLHRLASTEGLKADPGPDAERRRAPGAAA